MPRETVATERDFRIDLVWRRGVYAQLGVVSDEPVDTKDVLGTYSLWGDLSVADVDHLMKVLRRVKRQLQLAPNEQADDRYAPLAQPRSQSAAEPASPA